MMAADHGCPRASSAWCRWAEVVRVGRDEGLTTILRYQRERQVVLMANAGPGGSEGEISDAMLKAMQDYNLPKGFSIKPQGSDEADERDGALVHLRPASRRWCFMYLILAAQFESWLHPITILVSLPLTLPFAIASVILFGQALDLYSFFGHLSCSSES